MKLKPSLIAGAALALCSISSFAAAVDAAACTAAVVDGATAEALVNNCKPAKTLFIGGASTMSSNTLTVLNSVLFDTAAMTPIEIVDNVTTSKANVKAYVGKIKAGVGAIPAGTLIYVVYNYNNGSAGGVSQLLGKTPKLADQTNPLKAIPEADVPFVGPAKDQFTPDTKTANAFCGTAATGVTSTAAKVACNSHTTQIADMALSDVRADELYKVYTAAAKGKPSTLTQVPLFLQSFGVAVSQPLYQALQRKQGLVVGDYTAANQPSISSTEYASLVMKGGKIASLVDLVGAANVPAGDETKPLLLARRDDLSGTQAASNIFFVNGQCGGNQRDVYAADAKAAAATIDGKVKKAGGLMGGLAIREDVTDDTSLLDVQANVTSGAAKTAMGSTTDYAIGVANVGSGGLQGTAGRFVKIDGLSPNFDGTNFMNATATRNQLANGAYPFSFTMYGMYVTKTLDKDADKKAMVQAVLEGFKNSNLTNLSGIGYLDGADATKQANVNRANGNNCSPLVKL